jgi:hypothetical protein
VLRDRWPAGDRLHRAPDKERRCVGGAFINLTDKMRERLWSRVKAGANATRPSIVFGHFLRWLAQSSAERRNLSIRRQTVKQDARLEKFLAFAEPQE